MKIGFGILPNNFAKKRIKKITLFFPCKLKKKKKILARTTTTQHRYTNLHSLSSLSLSRSNEERGKKMVVPNLNPPSSQLSTAPMA